MMNLLKYFLPGMTNSVTESSSDEEIEENDDSIHTNDEIKNDEQISMNLSHVSIEYKNKFTNTAINSISKLSLEPNSEESEEEESELIKNCKKELNEIYTTTKKRTFSTISKKTTKFYSDDDTNDEEESDSEKIKQLKEEMRQQERQKGKNTFLSSYKKKDDEQKVKYVPFEAIVFFYHNKEIATMMLRANTVQDIISVETDFTIPFFSVDVTLQWIYKYFNYNKKYTNFLEKYLKTSNNEHPTVERFLLLPRESKQISESEYFLTKMNILDYVDTQPFDYNYKNKPDEKYHKVYLKGYNVELQEFEMQVRYYT